MKVLYKFRYAKTVATILTAMTLTLLIGTSSFALASGADSARGAATRYAQQATGVDVTQTGADGRDRDDDTSAIQDALNQYDSVYIPKGTYYINVDKRLKLKSNQVLTLDENAVLQALPTSSGEYGILQIFNVENVTVTGGQLVGDRASHSGSSGEWGMGIYILDSASISIENVSIRDCWGDGIYIGGDHPSKNVTINSVTSEGNRRQGLSITNAERVEIVNSEFINTYGTRPAAGIDIEPNDGETAKNISIEDTICSGNEGTGLDIVGWCERIYGITVSGCTISNNGESGIRIVNGEQMHINDTTVSGNQTGIAIPRDANDIEFIDVSVEGNSFRGVSLITTDQIGNTTNIVFESCSLKNNSKYSANELDGIRIDNYDASGKISEVSFKGCRFVDDQSSRTQRYGLTVGFSTGIYGVVVDKSCVFNGNVTGGYLGGNALTVQ